MHIVFAAYGSPKKLSEFEDLVNNKLRYEWEGRTRKGHHQPFLSRFVLGLYDVRIKQELAPYFLRDLAIVHPDDIGWLPKGKGVKKIIWLIQVLISFCRFFTPLHKSPKAEGPAGNARPNGWLHLWYVGSFKDEIIGGQESL